MNNKFFITVEAANQIKEEGEKAFNDGFTDEVCPYPIKNNYPGARQAWMDGYYGARTNKNVGHLLKKLKYRK